METTSLQRVIRRVSTLGIGLAGAFALYASVSQAQTPIQITNNDGTVLSGSASLYTTFRHCAPSGPATICEWYLRKLYGDNSAVVVTINQNGGDPACYSGFTQYIVSGYTRSGCAIYASSSVYGQ